MRAIWNGTILAESDDTVVVEGNHYFPGESLVMGHFEKSSHNTLCPWKGVASYFHVVVGDDRNENAAWYYPSPFFPAKKIKGRIAFWRGVEVVE